MVALAGNPDGSSEVDYTVNPATGFPWSTGPRNLTEPLNSVLPAWDVAMGTLAAVGLLAAERRRSRGGGGELISLALSDVAFAMVGNLGRIAEVTLGGRDHSKDGNYLYGAFGHDFETRDGRRVMVVALTARQWRALVDITGIAESLGGISRARRPRPGDRERALRSPRHDRRRPAARGSNPAIWPRSARRSRGPASPGAPTRPSASWSTRTRASRSPTRSSKRSSSRASAPTSRPARRSDSSTPGPSRRRPRRSSAPTPRRCSPRCSGSAPTRSASSTTTASSAANPAERRSDALEDAAGAEDDREVDHLALEDDDAGIARPPRRRR